jgi:diacylglycerol kinase family enzyme
VTAVTVKSAAQGTRPRRWLARLSFVLMVLAVVIVAVFAGLKSFAMLAVGLAGAGAGLAAAYFFLARRGVWRWFSLAVFVLAPLAVLTTYAFARLLWVAIVSAAAWLLAGVTARSALAGGQPDWRMPEHPAQPPATHPYVIMNPRSGGGKVEKFDLKRKAESLGAEVFLMSGPEPVDVAAVARQAVARGADLLGVAGGDGTQALVAGIAARHGIPFMVITAGTRNHFALDLGLDRENPAACLGALSDGVELRVDLGVIGGQTFVNNASFGAYAAVVESPAYRDDKVNTTLNMLPDLLQGHRGARLVARADGVEIRAPQALLVANNPYGTGDIAGLSRRVRLDRGMLGVVGVKVSSARQAVGLLRGAHAAGLSVLTAKEIEVTADARQIPVGIDGEAVSLPVPVRCAIRPGALRVWVPRDRPGVPPPRPVVNWATLRHLAAFGKRARLPAPLAAAPERAEESSDTDDDPAQRSARGERTNRRWPTPGRRA